MSATEREVPVRERRGLGWFAVMPGTPGGAIAAQFGAKGFSAYSASKAALDALMRSLAVELAPDVRANSVLPGAVRTPMTAGMFDDPDTAARLLRDYPLGVGEPRDVIDAVEFHHSSEEE